MYMLNVQKRESEGNVTVRVVTLYCWVRMVM